MSGERSDPKDLERLVVADGDPLGLSGRPVQVVHSACSRVGEYRVLDRARDR